MKKRYIVVCALLLVSQKSYHKELHNTPSVTTEVDILKSQEIKKIEANPKVTEESILSSEEEGLKDEVSSEDFEQYFQDLIEDGAGMYNLYINGRGVSRNFPIYKKEKDTYVSVYDFIDLLGLRDYSKKNGVLTVRLGIDGLIREINTETKDVEKKDKNSKIEFKKRYKDEIFEKNGALFIERKAFEQIFDSIVQSNDEKLTLNITTKFETPEDIEVILKNKFNSDFEKKESKDIIYESQGELFMLGNTRINTTQDFSKNANDKKYQKDWSGNLEYSGGLLYGNLVTSYDLKNSEVGTAELYYKDIWKGHSLTLGSYPNGEKRESGLNFKKEKGYYTDGKEIVLRERVPIGSVVELIYQGTAIDIQTAEDGYVEFRNVGIQLERTYTLKIYTPTGEIRTRDIQTSVTYNQQNKGEIEYSINLREDKSTGEYRGNADFYYGLTENLTLSSGFTREPIQLNSNKEYENIGGDGRYSFDDRVRGEAIYTDYIYNFPYTVSLNGERALSNEKQGDKNLEDLHTFGGMATINIKDLKLEAKEKHQGEYFDDKKISNYNARYTLFGSSIELTSNYEIIEKYDQKKEKNFEYGVNTAKSFGNYSIMGDYSRTAQKESIYRGDIYYNGFDKVSLRVSAEYKKTNDSEKDNYDVKVAIRNKGWNDKFDFSVEAKYKNTGESALGLSFSMKIDNWFVLNGSTDRSGNRQLGVGIDKVISLKNPTEKIDDINSSRVKVRTFLDNNRNNKWDDGEEMIPEMKVKIGEKEILTDEEGIGYIYGVSNGIAYEVKAELNRPEHHLSYTSMKVLPKSVSEIDVDIPVQPHVTLEGYISLDGLDIEEEEATDIYNKIVVTIIDEQGKELEHTVPEDDGMFRVSGLFSEKYQIKIQYLGNEENVESHIETIELAYGIPDRNRYVFSLKDKYSMLRKDERVE